MATKVIRICKGADTGRKSYRLGALNENWNPSHVVLILSESRIFTEIRDGKLDLMPIRYSKAAGKELYNKPVPKEEIVRELLIDNKEAWTTTAHGASPVMSYGERHSWYIDFEEDLRGFFEENELPIPADGKSLSQRVTEMALGQVAAMGLLTPDSAASEGAKLVEAAKAEVAAKQAELISAQAEIDSLKAQLAVTSKVVKKKDSELTPLMV